MDQVTKHVKYSYWDTNLTPASANQSTSFKSRDDAHAASTDQNARLRSVTDAHPPAAWNVDQLEQ